MRGRRGALVRMGSSTCYLRRIKGDRKVKKEKKKKKKKKKKEHGEVEAGWVRVPTHIPFKGEGGGSRRVLLGING
jgi:hypothetical protein